MRHKILIALMLACLPQKARKSVDFDVQPDTIAVVRVDTMFIRDIAIEIPKPKPFVAPDLGKYKTYTYTSFVNEHNLLYRDALTKPRDAQFRGKGMVQYIASKHDFLFPPSVLVVQSLFESGAGRSTLARKGNNYFGVKCFKHHEHKWCINLHDDYPSDQFMTFKTRYAAFIYQGEVLHKDLYRFFWKVCDPVKFKIRHRYVGKTPVFFPPYKWSGQVKDAPQEYWIMPGQTYDLHYWEWLCIYLDGQGYATSPFYARKLADIYQDLRVYNIDFSK